MPKFTGQNKKKIDPRYFLNETTEKEVNEVWKDRYKDAPSSAEFADETRANQLSQIYIEDLLPHAKAILLRLTNMGPGVLADAEDFAADLAHAAEGNNTIDILEFLLRSVGEDPDELADPDRYGEL